MTHAQPRQHSRRHQSGLRPHGRRLPGRVLWLVLLLAPCAASATPIRSNVAFTKVNQNPWTSGDAYQNAWTYTPSTSFDVTLPATSLTPWGLLSNFLHLPDIGFARAGAHVAGSFGLNLGYAVDGGRMNIVYPGNATVDMHGPTALGDYISPGVIVHTDTSFTPGLTHTYSPPSTFTPFTGITTSIPAFNLDSIEDPKFQTYFPNASAWAGFDYDLRAGFKVEAGVIDTPLGCVLCFSRSADFERKGTVEIANVNPAGVQLIGQDRMNLFGQDFALGAGTVRVDYPDLSVGGVLQADGSTLAGSGVASMITFNADLEKLIPFIGPFLHEAIGPFDLKLLGISGGPGLGLYQDFEVDVDPQVELRFNQPVMSYAGGATLTTTIRTTLGSSVDWMPIVNTGVPLSVQAVFIPDATIHNRTGFAVGYDLDVSALELGTPFVDIGPVASAHLADPGALKLPAFYDATFNLDLADIAVDPVTLDMLTGFERIGAPQANFRVAGLESSGDGDGSYTLLLVDQVSGIQYSLNVLGHLVTASLAGGSANDVIFVADGDVIVNYHLPNVDDPHGAIVPVNLGTYFCIQCTADTDNFVPVSPSFIDSASGDALFVNDLGNIRADDVDYLLDPDINRATFDLASVDRAVIGPIVALSEVPEPDALGLFGLGLLSMVLLALVSRMARKGMCQNKT